MSNRGKRLDPFGAEKLEGADFSDVAPVSAVRGESDVGAVVEYVLSRVENGAI